MCVVFRTSLHLWARVCQYAIFFSNKLSNVATIKRIWQMVQENCPEIRGNTWEERQRQVGMISKEMVFFDAKQLKMFDE